MAWRYLKHNKASWGPQNVLVVDTETTRLAVDGRGTSYVERFRLGVASFARLRASGRAAWQRLVFTDREQFWRLVESKVRAQSVLWVFAHNVGFDSRTLGFWQLLANGRFSRTRERDRKHGSKSGQRQSDHRTGLLVTADPPTIVEAFARNGGLIRMVDTLNYWPATLAEIGRWVGLEKLTMPDPWAPDEDWETYCKRDVEILERAIVKYVSWVKENQLGVFSLTMPSQAMHGFRHTMAAKSVVIHDEKQVQQLESEGYYGGEVYCGFLGQVERGPGTSQLALGESRPVPQSFGTRHVHHLDCNSLFPATMAGNLFPCRLLEWGSPKMASRQLVGRMDGGCIAECLLDTGSQDVFTRRAGRSGRFRGVFVAVLCGPELLAAIDAGLVVAIRRWARYQLSDLFSGFVSRHWQLRWTAKLAGDDFASQMHKRVMNSLYGKFAQRSYEWEDCPDMATHEPWGCWYDLDTTRGEIAHYRAIAGTVQRSVRRGYHENAFVAVSAFVTSYAREHMRRLRVITGERQVYYQGIDSLYVSDVGLERLKAAGEVDRGSLGKLRYEGSADTAAFMGWGLYRFGDKWVRTSIGRGAIECVPGEFEQQNFERLATALSHEPTDGVNVSVVKRTLAASPPVGIVDKDGWVNPLPAKWGDNPAETTGATAYGTHNLGHWSDSLATIGQA